MKYFWNKKQELLIEAARRFANTRIKPVRAELDEQDKCSVSLIKEMGKLDFCRIFIPEEYGGLNFGVTELCLVQEEFSRVCGGVSCAYSVNALGAHPIVKWGTAEQKKKYLPKIASGEYLTAFALTEAEAGSDASAIKTQAVPEKNGYRLNGTKIFITNGSIADVYVVLATINPKKGIRGITAFILEKGMEGFHFGEKENKMGIRATHTCDLIMDDVFVPSENMLGGKGKGFFIAMDNFDHSRAGVGAQALGIAQGAFDEALNYSTKRVQFGQPIISQQGIKFMIADMATQIEAARSLIYNAAATVDSGEKRVSKCVAMAKYFASDVAVKVTLDAIQIMGGYGYMKDYPVEKMLRDAKITQIYEGTNQIQRIVVAQEVIRELSK
ncbi:MAG: acyl-CoA dehydrogenase family protein [Caldisericia bacterium]|nr:acyl-CoA dehydrogenase family protein [Caldisericia bacterium]